MPQAVEGGIFLPRAGRPSTLGSLIFRNRVRPRLGGCRGSESFDSRTAVRRALLTGHNHDRSSRLLQSERSFGTRSDYFLVEWRSVPERERSFEVLLAWRQ